MLQKRKTFLSLSAGVILPLIFLTALRCSTLTDGETCMDPYYHIAVAETGPSLFMGKLFPHMTMSTWETNFSDKELLYHLILSGLRSWHSLMGFDASPPFNFPALFFAGLMLSAFVCTAFKLHIKHIWLYSLLLVSVSPGFTSRILMLRPHLLGITLLLAAVYFSARIKKISDLYILFILGFIASWSYSNPHFILLPVGVFALLVFSTDKKLAIAMPLLALGGIMAGMLLHPQFPNTLLTWKIQCVDAITQIFMENKPVFAASELAGINLLWLKENIIFVFLTSFNVIVFTLLLFKNKFNALSITLKALFIISTIANIGMIASGRAIEYACPFTVITTGLLIAEAQALNEKWIFFRKSVYVFLAGLTIGGAIYTSALYYNYLKDTQFKVPAKFAEWISKSNIPVGTVIANPYWSDFPVLYYALPQYKYLFGMDPMFAYSRNFEAAKKLELFRTGKLKITPAGLAALTKARFAYVSVHGWQLARDMHKDGYRLIYQDEDGYFFALPDVEK